MEEIRLEAIEGDVKKEPTDQIFVTNPNFSHESPVKVLNASPQLLGDAVRDHFLEDFSTDTLEEKLHLLRSTQDQIISTIIQVAVRMQSKSPDKNLWDLLIALAHVSYLSPLQFVPC